MSQTTMTGGLRVVPQTARKPWQLRLRHWLGQDWAAAYVFVFPTLLLMGGLIAYPFLRAVYMSFTNTVSLKMGPFVGLQNYENVWSDPSFHSAIKNTIVFTFWSIVIKFIHSIASPNPL